MLPVTLSVGLKLLNPFVSSQFPFGFGAAGHFVSNLDWLKIKHQSLNSLSGSVLPVTAATAETHQDCRRGLNSLSGSVLPVTKVLGENPGRLPPRLNSLSGSVLPVTKLGAPQSGSPSRRVSIPFRVRCCRSLRRARRMAADWRHGLNSLSGSVLPVTPTWCWANGDSIAVSQFPFGFGAAGHLSLTGWDFETPRPSLNSLSGSVLPVTRPRRRRMPFRLARSQFPFGFGAAGHAESYLNSAIEHNEVSIPFRVRCCRSQGGRIVNHRQRLLRLNSLSGSVLPVTVLSVLQRLDEGAASQFPFGFGAAGHGGESLGLAK